MTQEALLNTADESIDALSEALERDGAIVLNDLVSEATLRDMQTAFAARLKYQRTNNVEGYMRTELKRLMVEDALTLAQGFVDIAVHPVVTTLLSRYLGDNYALCEAKGWQSQPSKTDFHGWHGDMWYDQNSVRDRIPREVKLAFYLSDVKTGAFEYLKGTHQKSAPSHIDPAEIDTLPLAQIARFPGRAGTAILFDTSGIHRQGIPILEPRRAVFYNFHDPDTPLQKEDVEYYRYHPILLNAAFLGNLSPEQMRVLGFGNKQRLQTGYMRPPKSPMMYKLVKSINTAHIYSNYWGGRISSRLRRMFGSTA